MERPRFYTSEILKRVLPDYCQGHAIDVGAGRGKYRQLIQTYSRQYTSIDNLSSNYQFNTKELHLDVIADVLAIPFGNAVFDTVICTEVVEHVSDPFQLFSELSRVTRSDGYVILSSSWAAAYHREPKDYWRFSLDGYQVLAQKFNLEIIEAHKKGGLFSLLFYFINRNIELNTNNLGRIKRRLGRMIMGMERIFEVLDKILPTEDTVGHLIVARKR